MELCDKSLAHPDIRSELCNYELMSIYQRLSIAEEIAKGMEYIAQFKYRHLDLNPRNVLINQYYHIKITDFDSMQTKSNCTFVFEATPLYTAPEILLHNDALEQSDVFSFGLILNYLITAQDPLEHVVGEILHNSTLDSHQVLDQTLAVLREFYSKECDPVDKREIERIGVENNFNQSTMSHLLELLERSTKANYHNRHASFSELLNTTQDPKDKDKTTNIFNTIRESERRHDDATINRVLDLVWNSDANRLEFNLFAEKFSDYLGESLTRKDEFVKKLFFELFVNTTNNSKLVDLYTKEHERFEVEKTRFHSFFNLFGKRILELEKKKS